MYNIYIGVLWFHPLCYNTGEYRYFGTGNPETLDSIASLRKVDKVAHHMIKYIIIIIIIIIINIYCYSLSFIQKFIFVKSAQ